METKSESRYYPSKKFKDLVFDIIDNEKPRSGVFTLKDILHYKWYYWQLDIIKEYFLYEVLIDEMFKMAGHPEINFDYVSNNHYIDFLDWYQNWNWDEKTQEKFKTKILKRAFKKIKPNASDKYYNDLINGFMLMYGLTLSSNEEIEKQRVNAKNKYTKLANEYNKSLDEIQKMMNDCIKTHTSIEHELIKEKYDIDDKLLSYISSKSMFGIENMTKYINEHGIENIKDDYEKYKSSFIKKS